MAEPKTGENASASRLLAAAAASTPSGEHRRRPRGGELRDDRSRGNDAPRLIGSGVRPPPPRQRRVVSGGVAPASRPRRRRVVVEDDPRTRGPVPPHRAATELHAGEAPGLVHRPGGPADVRRGVGRAPRTTRPAAY